MGTIDGGEGGGGFCLVMVGRDGFLVFLCVLVSYIDT